MNTNFKFRTKKTLTAVLPLAALLLLQACKQSPTDFATKWTKEMKEKIIEDASQQSDSTFTDTVHHELTILKGNKKLKQFYFAARKDQNENEKIKYDTGMIVLFSTDQNFQYIRQPLIPDVDRSYEGVAYKGNRFGAAEYIYRKDKIRETAFHIKNLNVGTWIRYDSTGKKIDETDNGNAEKLEQLKEMKYYR
jgi:hypothetical protein